MSNESIIFVSLKYFLSCLQPYLIKAKKAKSAKDDLTTDVFTRGLSAKNTSV